MREYVLLTDSCCDLGPEVARRLGLYVLPLTFSIEGREYYNYLDGRDMEPQAFYEKIRAGRLGTTSAISVGVFGAAMEQILCAGRDVLCIAFSSALSATYQNASIAAQDARAAHPEGKVLVVDSRAASLGQGLLVTLAARQKEQGRTIEEVAAYVEETRDHLCHWFTVDDLHHLKRGGRVSAAAAFLGTMIQMKPVLHVDDEGRLIPVSKVRGRRASLRALLNKMSELATNVDTVYISHGDCLEEAEDLAAAVKERFGAKEVYINFVGPVIGNHSGPGTMALFFLGKKK